MPAAVLLLALSGRVQLCVSEPVLAEYEAVIRRSSCARVGGKTDTMRTAERTPQRHEDTKTSVGGRGRKPSPLSALRVLN